MIWVDPTQRVRRGALYPWPLPVVMLRDKWLLPAVGARQEPVARAHGHARAVWEHMDWLVSGAGVASGRLEPGSVDTDLEFLAAISRHVVGCRDCVARNGRGRPTGQDVLWRAVGRVPSLRALAETLDHPMG